MKKTYVAIIAVVVVLAVGAGGWYLHSRNTSSTTSASSSSSGGSNSSGSSSSGSGTGPGSSINQPANPLVTIQNFAFSPATMTVHTGTTVKWTNNDSVTHTVTETDGLSGPNSSDVAPGQTYSFTFAKAGTYHYHCSIHPEMTGVINVTDAL